MTTLEQILDYEKAHRKEEGMYGIKACKESILSTIDLHKNMNEIYNTTEYVTNLYQLLESYVKRYNENVFFNGAMILACWELINNK